MSTDFVHKNELPEEESRLEVQSMRVVQIWWDHTQLVSGNIWGVYIIRADPRS